MHTDKLDRRLLDQLQAGIPLIADPFAAIAGELSISPEELLARIQRLRSAGIIRQISAIFDTKSLGYESCLVAGRVAEDRLPGAVAFINGHPGVTHNYRRDHEYNLWFTLAVPPREPPCPGCEASTLGLEQTVELLRAGSGAEVLRLMQAVRVFKIGVRFQMTSDNPAGEDEQQEERVEQSAGGEHPAGDPLTASDVAAVRALQDDLPCSRDPFAQPAGREGLGVDELLAAGRRMLADGRMRRFAAVLHHRAAGFAANAMVVWAVPDERVEAVGRLLASFPAVSHCYQRPTFSDWPFNLFTMLHARTAAECESHLSAMRDAAGVSRLAVLRSLEEYKKVRLRFFTGEIAKWERACLW